MLKILTVLLLTSIFFDAESQRLSKKNKIQTIDFTNFNVTRKGETIKSKRVPQAERERLQSELGMDGVRLITRISAVESLLDNKKEGLESDKNTFDQAIQELGVFLKMKNISIDLSDYLTEFSFYSRYPAKKIKFQIFHLIREGEEIKYKRMLPSERFLIENTIATRILILESTLNNKMEGSEDNFTSFKHFDAELTFLVSALDESKFVYNIDVSDYQNEFAFYQRHPVKSKESLAAEAKEKEHIQKQKLRDSLTLIAKRQEEISDSISRIELKASDQKIRKQNIDRQKAINDQIKAQQVEKEKQERIRRLNLIQTYGKDIGDLIYNKQVKIGWTKAMCLESWGKPKDINRTITLNTVHEQWVYSLKRYLYFENDTLTAIQD